MQSLSISPHISLGWTFPCAGLYNLDVIYAHKSMATLMSTKLPDGVTLDRTYSSRGWCSFERTEGMLIKPDSFCIDLGLFSVDMACEKYEQEPFIKSPLRIGEAPFAQRTVMELAKQGSDAYYGVLSKLTGSVRRAPLAPAAFAELLKTSCNFTNPADAAVVFKLYDETATALLGSAKELKFDNRGLTSKFEWATADYQHLGEALRYCGALESLELRAMGFDAAGSAAVQAWVLPPSVKRIAALGQPPVSFPVE